MRPEPVNVHRLGGRGPRRILLLHGFSDDGACWAPLAARLGELGVLRAPDARGHGRSGLPEEAVTIETLADDAAAVIEDPTFWPDQTSGSSQEGVLVIGHSMGADTAAALAVRRPELVGALVLEDPPWRSGPVADFTSFASAWIDDLQRHTPAELVERCRAENPGWSDAELAPWAEAKLHFRRHFLDLDQEWRLSTGPETAARISCPTLLVTADPERGGIVTRKVAEQVTAAMADGHLVHLDGAGHSIRRDLPDAYVAAIAAFLG